MLEKIKEMLEDKIADLFIEMQDELKITDGFVHPVDEYELEKEIEKMASTVQNILKTQEEREVGMTFEEIKKRSDYRFVVQDWFIENNLEELRRGKFNFWTEWREKDGVHEGGLAFLECGWIDVELNISCDFDDNGKGINKPVASYFCCVKGRYVDEEEDDDEFRSTGWGNAGYLDDFGYEVNVDWKADNWKEQLERDMFIKLSMFMREFDLKFDEPNWRGIDAEFDVFDRIHGISKVYEEKGAEKLSDDECSISFSELINEVSKTEKEKTIKTVMSRIENGEDYREYIEKHLGEAIDVAKHHGSLFDLDQILHLKDLLGITVSYDLYHYINGKLDDLAPVDLGLEDRVELYTWVIEYANGKENA